MSSTLRERCRLRAAEWVLDRLSTPALRALIDEAVDAGFMSPHCLDALASGAPLEAMLPAFADLLAAQGLAVPDPMRAGKQLVHDRLSAIARGEGDALALLREAVDIARWDLGDAADADGRAAVAPGLFALIGLECCIGDLHEMQHPVFDGEQGDAAWQALREAIRRAAADWLQRG